MNDHRFSFFGETLHARPSGALWWPRQATLVVSDLHLGKTERMARRRNLSLPPYADAETLDRLGREVEATRAARVISLGDGFDDDHAAHCLTEADSETLRAMMQGRDWIWITGNHDPAAPPYGGWSRSELIIDGLAFRHIADCDRQAEFSGHYHPKARLFLRGTSVSRPCFLIDMHRVILPAFGAYTGGLDCTDSALSGLMRDGALAVLTGQKAHAVPMPRSANAPPQQAG